jgi:hypothetical protein
MSGGSNTKIRQAHSGGEISLKYGTYREMNCQQHVMSSGQAVNIKRYSTKEKDVKIIYCS